MMLTVYKYDLPHIGIASFDLPAGAQLLSVDFQGSYLKLWALVDTEAKPELAKFAIALTGMNLTGTENAEFIGTATQPNGLGIDKPYVVHVFRVRP